MIPLSTVRNNLLLRTAGSKVLYKSLVSVPDNELKSMGRDHWKEGIDQLGQVRQIQSGQERNFWRLDHVPILLELIGTGSPSKSIDT